MTLAEFLVALEDQDAPLRVLVELTFAYYTGSAPATSKVYLSDGVYATGPADTPASISYIDAITALPRFSRELDAATLQGAARQTVGVLELDNVDGRLDFMLDLMIDGHPCEVFIGQPHWRREQFLRVLYAVADTVQAPSMRRLELRLRDPGLLLNRRIAGAVVGGSTANADRRKPLVLGYPKQVEGILGDTSNLRYWVGGTARPLEVRDSGLSLTSGAVFFSGTSATIVPDAGTDRLGYTAHGLIDEDVIYLESSGTYPGGLAAGYYWVRNRTANDFQLSTTRTGSVVDITSGTFTGTMFINAAGFMWNGDGSIDVAHTPAGRITADPATSTTAAKLSAAIEAVVLTHAALPPSRWLGADASLAARIGTSDEPRIGYVISEPENAIDVLDRLCAADHWWYGFNSAGLFTFGRCDMLTPAASPYAYTVGLDDLAGKDSLSYEHLPPTYDVLSIVHARSWTRQADGFAAAVTPANVARWAGPGLVRKYAAWPSGTAPTSNPRLYHLSMTDAPQVDSTISGTDDSDSQSFADVWLGQQWQRQRPHWEIVRLEVGLRFAAVELGNRVPMALDLPGHDTGGGNEGFCAGVDIDLTARRVRLTLARVRTRNLTTAAFYG